MEMIHVQTEELRNRYVIVANPDLIAIKDPDIEELIQLRCLGCQSLFPPKVVAQSTDVALGLTPCIFIVAPTSLVGGGLQQCLSTYNPCVLL